jgi:hypothetical protein
MSRRNHRNDDAENMATSGEAPEIQRQMPEKRQKPRTQKRAGSPRKGGGARLSFRR